MGPALLLAAAALALPVPGAGPPPGPPPARLRLLFTPPRCRLRCSGGRCAHLCPRGNATALESGRPPGGSGFRLVVCPLLCRNGGVCARPDACLCPPEFTGKFCHLPSNGTHGNGGVPQNPGGPQALTRSVYTLPLANHREEEDGAQSMVSIHVQHPPEASVTIHQVERVREGEETPPAPRAPPPAPRAPPYRVLAQSSPRVPPAEEGAGYGYCFRQLRGGECSSPLPGLRTQDICCRGAGVAWGVHECHPCDGHPQLPQQDAPCPHGFQHINGSCVDVDECREGGFCQNGLCTNTRGSFACLCQPGFLLDASRSRCISHQVISEARGPCYRVAREGRCALPTLRNITRQICCCSRVGKAWGGSCLRCPPFGSEGFKEICPAGPGYHYAASDLRYNTRYLGQDLARVPLGRPRAVPAAPPATPRWEEERRPLPVTWRPPLVPERPPLVPERPPSVPERPPSVPERPPLVPERPPLVPERPPSVPERPPLVPERPPLVPERPPSVPERPPLVPERPPSVPERPPLVPERPPSVPERPPLVPERPPLVPERPPSVPERPPLVPERPPLVPERPPLVPERPPSVPERPPSVPERPPLVPERPPSVPERPPSVPERPPPAPEVIVVPRPTQGLLAPLPTVPPREGPGPAPVGSVCERNPQICGPGRCVPRQGGYTCLCHPGFWLSTQGTHCIDVDECRRSPRPCPNGRCENSVGSYRCLCSPGYRPTAAGTHCQDVDECAQSPPPCAHGRCENLPGGYRCACPAGYRAPGPEGPCRDIDECENHLACPGQECVNTPGSFQCQPCREGFQLHRGRCADVDECAAGSPCGPHGRCVNAEGSFRCECRRGYRAGADGGPCADINECLEGDFCFPHGECLNTEGSYSCLCAQGYASTPQGTACADVDECQRGGVCEGGRCANTDGSFECRCPPGFRTDADKARCHDVDECQEYGGSLCGAQRCDNVPGSYRCVPECQPGYRAGDGGDCVDVDECQEYGGSLCGAQRCDNVPGSYRCVPECQPGYRAGDGGDCVDVDECSNGTLCGAHAACRNLPGSFQCVCDPGYESARHGHGCVDVDECETLRGVCGAERCENVEGSFLCLCPDTRDEFDPVTGRCVTPPAPQNPPRAPPEGAACFSRACGVLAPNVSRERCCCSLGWAWGTHCPARPCPAPGTEAHLAICPHGQGRTAEGPQGSPADVDECQLFGPQLCRGGVCLNAAPGFSCYCPSGYYYEQEHLQCVDNDECGAEDAEPCLGGRCVNTVGSYYCSCPPPLVLDGSQRRCVANDTHLDAAQAVCWQEVGVDLVCGRPRLDRQVTYTECCCLYGQAWGMDCALCPARHSDDFEFLCNVLRPPSYGPPRAPPSYEYAPDFAPPYGLPYGPDVFGGPRVPPPALRSDYDPYGFGGLAGGYDPRGDALYAPPRYEGEDFEDPRRPLAHRPRGPRYEPPDPPPGSPWSYQPHGTGGFSEEEEEEEEEEEDAGGAEECGVLSGCHHGRCVRVPDGFTCDCDAGYRLDPARLDCVDIDECSQAPLCLPGRCLNTPGSFRCLCPPGHAPALPPTRCVPAPPRA